MPLLRSLHLHRHFARRMFPLALGAGLVVAAAPPIAYRVVAWRQLGSQAQTYAALMAAAVQRAIEQDLYLWRYNLPKILGAIAGHRGQRDIGAVGIADCAGRPLFPAAALGVGSGMSGGPVGSAAVLLGSRMVARVRVHMDPSPQRAVLGGIAVVSTGVGGLLALLLFWFPTRVVRRQALQLGEALSRQAAAEQELRELNAELTSRVAGAVEEVQRLSEQVVRLQEDERRRIARDLHDGVGQAVTALQIELRLAAGGPAAEAGQHLGEAVRLAEEILGEIRNAVFELRPAELAEMTLEQALRDCVERFEVRTGIPASFRVEGDLGATPEAAAVGLLRILQEALTNVSRHSQASEVGVLICVTEDRVRLTVDDDGRGMGEHGEEAGSGLRGMRERAAFLGGELQVTSRVGEGTRVAVTLPLHRGAA